MSWGEVLDERLALPRPPHYLAAPPTSHFRLAASPDPQGYPWKIRTQSPSGLPGGGAPQKAGTRQGEEKSPPCQVRAALWSNPLAWSLTEAPDQEAGPHKGEPCPSSPSGRGATGGYCRSSGRRHQVLVGLSSSLTGPRKLLQLGLGWKSGDSCPSPCPGEAVLRVRPLAPLSQQDRRLTTPPRKPGITLGLQRSSTNQGPSGGPKRVPWCGAGRGPAAPHPG